jgi:hypothetical protein
MSRFAVMFAFLAIVTRSGWAGGTAQGAAPSSRPSISLTTTTEEGKQLLLATVTTGGKPVENATVSFAARRLFGQLLLGEEKSLDDGTAAVPFPADLPGDFSGTLEVTATLQPTTPTVEPLRAVAKLRAGVAATHTAGHPFPRALWAPQAPLTLIAIVFVFVGVVWLTYLYVVLQLFRLRRGAGT